MGILSIRKTTSADINIIFINRGQKSNKLITFRTEWNLYL